MCLKPQVTAGTMPASVARVQDFLFKIKCNKCDSTSNDALSVYLVRVRVIKKIGGKTSTVDDPD